eukprot:TRINITY_DN26161_c1_g1_i1.p1 TRINITY_DN26161_c1_g1~~TRINITY_DN26161_c1_g1_i1.p1  ORF type:complete len:776 (+),score=218.60 TRINITY_DN26161_c1_g1_i1:74-2329(+)
MPAPARVGRAAVLVPLGLCGMALAEPPGSTQPEWLLYTSRYMPVGEDAPGAGEHGEELTLAEAQTRCRPPACAGFTLRPPTSGSVEGRVRVWLKQSPLLSEDTLAGWASCVRNPLYQGPLGGGSTEEVPPSDDRQRSCAEAEAQSPAALHARALDLLFAAGDSGERNVSAARELFAEAARRGHAGSQFHAGVLHAAGLGGPVDIARAVLLLTFAARGGSLAAARALAHRHQHGYGVPRSCADAAARLRAVADAAVAADGGTGRTLGRPEGPPVRLSDPSELRAKGREQQVLSYLEHSAGAGAAMAMLILGYAHQFGCTPWGQTDIDRDPELARDYFERAAAGGDPAAHGALGQFLAHDSAGRSEDEEAEEGRRQALERAREHLSKGAQQGHAVSLNGLGWLAANGVASAPDLRKARALFEQAVERGSPDALYNLGVLHLHGMGVPRNPAQAVQFLRRAANKGHLTAHWLLGVVHMDPGHEGAELSCANSVAHLGLVAGRGVSEEAARARRDYVDGDYASALLRYILAAEQGCEPCMSNAAYLLEQGYGTEEVTVALSEEDERELREAAPEAADADPDRRAALRLAYRYHRMAQEAGSPEAAVRVGTAHYAGLGARQDLGLAAANYRQAAEQGSSEGLYSLGWMHEHGAALQQDLPLAMQLYRRALGIGGDGWWAAQVAIWGLQLHSWALETTGLAPPNVTLSDRPRGLLAEDALLLLLSGAAAVAMAAYGALLVAGICCGWAAPPGRGDWG